MVALQMEANCCDPPGRNQSGPDLTFDDLVVSYQDELFRYALRLTRNKDDADDLYQDCLLKAYKAFPKLEGTANHRAWLYKIMTNTFISEKRKMNRLQPLGEFAIEVPDRVVDQSAQLDARDLLTEVQTFVDSLPDKQRIALILRKYQEFDYAAIASTLNSSEDAARANVYEAVRKLRQAFGARVES